MWTNIGVKINNDSRIIYPADYAILNADRAVSYDLYRAPFPFFDDRLSSKWKLS